MSADTINFVVLADKNFGLGIATIVLAVLAGVILQFTRRFRRMPAFFVSTFTSLKSKTFT